VPRALGSPRSFDELTVLMHTSDCHRVFLKPAHGSSASGIIAYRTDGKRHQAITTVETVREKGEMRLFNSILSCKFVQFGASSA
jgi:hypothetical protein